MCRRVRSSLTGVCEGSITCSTRHVILPPEQYDVLPEPSHDANEVIDLASSGCHVYATKETDGMDNRLTSATRNIFVDASKKHTVFPSKRKRTAQCIRKIGWTLDHLPVEANSQ